jgi:hypothetical protein
MEKVNFNAWSNPVPDRPKTMSLTVLQAREVVVVGGWTREQVRDRRAAGWLSFEHR